MHLVFLSILSLMTFANPSQAAANPTYLCNGKPLEPRSLVRIGYAFAKDARRVCYFNRELKGLNPRALKIRRGGVSTDGKRVFVHYQEVQGADPMTLKYVGYRYYRDARRVYYREASGLRTLDGMDPASFRLHGAYYTSDKSGVYWNGFRVPAADRRTFRVTSLHGAKDRYRVFRKGVSTDP
jgi:hypothetical protein